MHIPVAKHFNKNISNTSNERQKHDNPYPHSLFALSQTVNNAGGLQCNGDIIEIIVQKNIYLAQNYFGNYSSKIKIR